MKHQYYGQLGKQTNRLAAVSLSIANAHARLPVAFRLYLPKDWADDPKLRKKAGVLQHRRADRERGAAQVRQVRGNCDQSRLEGSDRYGMVLPAAVAMNRYSSPPIATGPSTDSIGQQEKSRRRLRCRDYWGGIRRCEGRPRRRSRSRSSRNRDSLSANLSVSCRTASLRSRGQ